MLMGCGCASRGLTPGAAFGGQTAPSILYDLGQETQQLPRVDIIVAPPFPWWKVCLAVGAVVIIGVRP